MNAKPSRLQNRIATRGPAKGECNICGTFGPLTEDHTPPKGCYRPKQVELLALIRRLADPSHGAIGPESRLSQNGVKYKTLCHRCNNALLGAKYDLALIDFVNSVAMLLNASIELPPEVRLNGQPQAIARSVLGHMAAQGVGRYKKGPLTEAVRDFMIDESLPLPDGISIFYWAYPYRSHIMFRDAAYADLRTEATFAMWVLKFFPIAFMITWDEPTGPMPIAVQSLTPWRHAEYQTIAELPVRLFGTPHEQWPEAPSDTHIVAVGQEAIHVQERAQARSAGITV